MSHNQRMEQTAQQNQIPTKANQTPALASGVFLNGADAEEYRVYKKRKKLTEISSALAHSSSTLMNGEDVQRVCERAARLRQSAVKLPLSKLSQAAFYLAGSGVKLDCVVGGTGETLGKIKAYETRAAVRRKANEITVIITPSLLDSCRYGEVRREIKKVMRAAGKASVKVRVEKAYTLPVLGRLARVCSEVGAKYFSVPYFVGCERLRMDLTNGCGLEVTGVETLDDFKKLTETGVHRIVTARAWEIYAEWLKEVNEMNTPVPTPTALPKTTLEEKQPPKMEGTKTAEAGKTAASEIVKSGTATPRAPLGNLTATPLAGGKNPETDYRCRLEGSYLKFF